MIVLSPTGYVFLLLAEQNPLALTESILFLVLPLLLVIRLVVVAMQLGQNMSDHDFLKRMDSWSYPPLYLAARLFGFAGSAD